VSNIPRKYPVCAVNCQKRWLLYIHPMQSQRKKQLRNEIRPWVLLAFSMANFFSLRVDRAFALYVNICEQKEQPVSTISSSTISSQSPFGGNSQDIHTQVNTQKSTSSCETFEELLAVTPQNPENQIAQVPPRMTPPGEMTPVAPNVNLSQGTPSTPLTPIIPAQPVPAVPRPAPSPPPPPPPAPLPPAPQLDSQPNELPSPASGSLERKLEDSGIHNIEAQEDLKRRLREIKQSPPEFTNLMELGVLKVKPIQPLPTPLPQPEKPVVKSKPLGYLLGFVSYFHTNNIFSSAVDPVDDGLIFTGLSLNSSPITLGKKTFLSGSVDGNIIKYIKQSDFDYNQVRFNLSLYHQLTSRMFGEIGFSNLQLFYAKDGIFFSDGDKFLNENSFRLSLGRRDSLAKKLSLDTFYEFRLSLAEPQSRDRIVNSLFLSLNYQLIKSLNLSLDYQFGLSDFITQERYDNYHRILGRLNYGISDLSNVSLQGGVSIGNSTDKNIDFDGWFFSLTYTWDLSRF
jgi:hypothetical protein